MFEEQKDCADGNLFSLLTMPSGTFLRRGAFTHNNWGGKCGEILLALFLIDR